MSLDKRIEVIRRLARQDKKAALDSLQELLAKHPDDRRLWSLQASIHARSKIYNAAIKSIDRAISLSHTPRQKAAYFYQRGRYNLQNNDAVSAISDFGEALENDDQIDPTFAQEVYFHRAESFIRLGKKQEALADVSNIQDNYETWTFKLRKKSDLIADCKKL